MRNEQTRRERRSKEKKRKNRERENWEYQRRLKLNYDFLNENNTIHLTYI